MFELLLRDDDKLIDEDEVEDDEDDDEEDDDVEPFDLLRVIAELTILLGTSHLS
jgi:hypothetical protein